MSIAWTVIASSAISAQDLSRYREFRLGMPLITVARQAGITPEPRVVHRAPELIQELMWQPPRVSASLLPRESAAKVLFSFYNDQLYRIVVTYDRERTLGLTAEDLVEAMSTKYGLARLPFTETASSNVASNDASTMLAHWEDSQHSLDLLSSPPQSTFGLVMLSIRLDALAQAAIADWNLLDLLAAPQREIERQHTQTEGDRVKHAEARRVNRSTFRP
jgi:hypothetical protein